MRRRDESQRFDPAGDSTVNVYERARAGRWILVDSFHCRVRVRRMICRPKAARP
ncbi:hypothetical protein LJR225_005160 [Phenylobacterium sp. LjRoot225]|uniref:hypothetical protein n=1 Tax=Phenylobacterium sp. LjRoot225 TaxID=3342285 RepID=UPI003ECFF61F